MRVFSALGCDCDLLEWERGSCVDLATLEDRRAISKYEVYGAVDGAFAVELAERVDVESVLVPFHATTVEG